VRGGGLLKMLPIGRWRAPMRRAALSAAVALAASLAGGEAARAACDPAAGSNVTATCTGATNDQGGGAPGTSAGSDGYGTGAETNLDVTVVPGASVTGTNRGIFFNTGSVINSGTITGGRGIDATTANVTNSGTITGTLEGINAVTASVINSGTITGGPRGIVTTGIASVINSGTVTATTGIGIQSLTTANVTNSGTISGAVFGISADTANVSNSGTISGGDGIAAGIANVGNSGTISGTDFGIRAVTTASVTNSGTISGGIAALQFAGNPDTLTLLAGSRIIGAINLAGGGDTVNFRGGNHNLTFDTLAGARVTGTTPFAVSGNRAVAVDPTPFAMTDRNLMDVSRTVAAVIPEIDTAASPGGAPLAFAAAGRSAADVVGDAFAAAMPGLAYAGETAVNPTAVYAGGTAVWARGFVGKRVQQGDGTLLRTENTFYGGMLGADWQAGPNLRVGVFAGGGEAKSSLDLNYGDTKSTLVFGGAYARYRLASAFLHLTVQGGHSGNDTRRQINNNLVPGGIETATASFSGWYATPEAHLGFHHALGIWGGASYTLTPSLRLRYLYASFDGYTESGSTANLTVGTRSVQDFEERGELKFTRTQAFGATAAIATSIYGGVLAVQRVGDSTVDAALLGQAIPFATPGEDNVWGGYGGVGLAWHAERITVFGAAEYSAVRRQLHRQRPRRIARGVLRPNRVLKNSPAVIPPQARSRAGGRAPE
jgi:outer membrane autotransporter protein